MTPTRPWLAPVLVALAAVFPPSGFFSSPCRRSQLGAAASPLSVAQPGPDRLPLRGRHLDGKPQGGEAGRLTSNGQVKAGPYFSPDGAWIAYSAHLSGNTDAYVIPAGGPGGDAMPWYFRKAGVGKLVGMRTWGGLVGIGGYPSLLDNGFVMAPRYAIYGIKGEWEVENHGIPPDVAVEDLPADFAAGHDRQLETGMQMAMDELKTTPAPQFPVPPYPNYHKNDGLGNK